MTLQKVLLTVKEINPPHTAQKIRGHINATLVGYEIDPTKCHFLTDAGANVKAAMRLDPELDSNECSAHGLHNLVMVDCIKREISGSFSVPDGESF